MNELGFSEITNPIMLNTVGKTMTINKGMLLRKIDNNLIYNTFKKYNFLLEDLNEWINK